MTVNNDRIKIIEKIAALLAKADSTTFEAEAETARRLAAKLISNYEIKNSELGSKEEFVIVNIDSGNARRKNMKHALCYTFISEYCGVYMITCRTQYRLIGKKNDVEAAIYMMNVIWSQVEQMTERWYAKAKRNYGVSAKDKNSYQHGLISGVHYNLDKINAEVFKYKREAGLVPVNQNVADKKKAEDWYTNQHKVKQNNVNVRSGAAYQNGMKDSENITMRNRVATNNNLALGW